MENNHPIIYNGKFLGRILEDISGNINLLLKEAEIFESFFNSFSNFVSVKAEQIPGFKEKGWIWCNRFITQGERAHFCINFNPIGEEKKKLRYEQRAIATGNLLNKTIDFDIMPEVCLNEVFTMLKETFRTMGFGIGRK